MAHPRIRDFVTYLTTLPAAMMIFVCLFLPHQRDCSRHVDQTPFDTSLWVMIAPLVVLGVLPVLWRVAPRIQPAVPELVLAFTMIVMALIVVTIPVAIWLMWGYSKRRFRGEVLVAMCSTSIVMMWLFGYPLLTMFDKWLPAAEMTWGAAVVLMIGFIVWTSAALTRERRRAEVITRITRLPPSRVRPRSAPRSCAPSEDYTHASTYRHDSPPFC